MKKLGLPQIVGVLANLGVLAGIVFLAIEIRQNTRAQELGAYQDIVGQIAELSQLWVKEPEDVEEIFRILQLPPTALSEFESTRAAAFSMLLLRHGDLVYFQYQRGVISEERMQSGLTILGNIICTPYVHGFWPTARAALDVSYGDFVDARIQACSP